MYISIASIKHFDRKDDDLEQVIHKNIICCRIVLVLEKKLKAEGEAIFKSFFFLHYDWQQHYYLFPPLKYWPGTGSRSFGSNMSTLLRINSVFFQMSSIQQILQCICIHVYRYFYIMKPVASLW